MNLKLLSCPFILAATLATGSAASRTVACRVVLFAKNPAMPVELFSAGKSGKKISKTIPSLSVEARPVELSVLDSGDIEFKADDQADSPVVAVASIPPAVKNVFLFLMEDDNPEDDILFKTVILEDSPENTRSGGAIIHNATPGEGRVLLGKETTPLTAGETVRLPTPSDRDEYNMVPLKVEIMNGDQWTAIKEGFTRFSSRDLYLIFAYPGTKPGETRIKIYRKSVAISTTGGGN